MPILSYILTALGAYLLGSIPFGFLMAKAKGIDIRKAGSGNIGATNALRVLGKPAGIAVLLLDVAKGFAAVWLCAVLVKQFSANTDLETLRVVAGIGAVLGHNYTCWLKFKGGKGIATTLGVLIGLSFKIAGLKSVLGLVILTWIIVFAVTRIVSLSSISSAVLLPVYMMIFRQSKVLIFSGLLLSIFAIIRHKSNLLRLLQGKEPRLSFKKTK